MSDAESKYSELLSELRFLEDQLNDLQSRIHIVSAQVQEHIGAGVTMNSLKEEHGREALIPIGAQLFVRGSIADTSKVFIGLGAGISVEKTVEHASADLESRVASMQKILADLRNDYLKLADRVSKLRSQLGEAAQRILKGKGKESK
nr:prefoldin subunit alpha [Candidatus Njordarchaeum guaymaensis]